MLLRLLLVMLLALDGGASLAADAPAEEPPAAADTDSTDSSEDASDTGDEADAPPPLRGETFVPSVRISEDLSVSFPTDI